MAPNGDNSFEYQMSNMTLWHSTFGETVPALDDNHHMKLRKCRLKLFLTRLFFSFSGKLIYEDPETK